MLTTAYRRLLIASLPPRFAFSQTTKPTPESTPSTPPQSKPAEQEIPINLKRGQQPDPDEQEDTLHSEDRNTLGWWIYRFFFWGATGVLAYDMYKAYNHKGKSPVENAPGVVPYFIGPAKWLVNGFNDAVEFITQPPSKKLLYDPVHPDLHPKTLVLNLTGTIIKSQYIFGKGIKTTLRPGLENMLKRLSQKYEIVIFAEEDEMTIMTKIMKIDPRQMHIRGILGRESMVWKGGEFVKDLRYLNRDLKKIVAVDRRAENVKNQPENTIILPEFDGSEDDNELTKLTFLLEKLADVPDVRKYLSTLGENPVNSFYGRARQAQEKLNKKASIFGVFGAGSKNPPKQQRDEG